MPGYPTAMSEFDLEDRETHRCFTVSLYCGCIEPEDGCNKAFVALHRSEIKAAISGRESAFFLR